MELRRRQELMWAGSSKGTCWSRWTFMGGEVDPDRDLRV